MRSKFYLFVSLFTFVFMAVSAIDSIICQAHVPDTGQTKCYDSNTEILCPLPGNPLYGQDANYPLNAMSYTKLDSNGNTLPDSATSWAMIRDNVTELIWENKTDDGSIHDKDNYYTWYDSNQLTNGANAGTPGDGTDTEDFIKSLNDSKFGGYSDWRLPTPQELASIVDYSIQYSTPLTPNAVPAISDKYFPYTQHDRDYFYWSATTTSNYNYNAWGLYFYDGHVNYTTKKNRGYVRAVRGGDYLISRNLIINGNGTVSDLNTGLTWQQTTDSSSMTWQEAIAYCENLNLGGYTDWRLPNIKELQTIIDYRWYSPAVNVSYFPDTLSLSKTSSLLYWTSTSQTSITEVYSKETPIYNTENGENGWTVNFINGYTSYPDKDYKYNVRAVRGGLSRSVVLEADSSFTIPCMALNDDKFSIKFRRTENPFLWIPDVNTLNERFDPSFECIDVNDDFSFHIPLMNDNGKLYSIDFKYSLAESLWKPDLSSIVVYGDIDVKRGSIPVIDGIFSENEWVDAGATVITVEPDWLVTVYYKHDDSNLYIAFGNLIRDGRAFFPEILLDINNDKQTSWQIDDWWLHASAADCEGNGKYNVWSSCQEKLIGWDANNFLRPQDIVEIQISYEKLGLVSLNKEFLDDKKIMGIAFSVTDKINKSRFWPPEANLENPSTWAVMKSSDSWK
ncbi:MAG: DUF1566 domain-containing protein [Desulfamplus sp.]|nr:DUF1566 domain-containing protein [Desulfamplus sp.]